MVKKLSYNQYNALHQLLQSQGSMELAAFNRLCNDTDFGRLLGDALITVESQHVVKIADSGRVALDQFPIFKMEEKSQAKYHRKPTP